MQRYLVFVLLIVVLALGLFYYRPVTEEQKKAFFTDALQAAQVEVPDSLSLPSLERAYALTLAKRSPQFGLAGTDPDALDAQTDELARVQVLQAAALSSAGDAAAVRAALYPIAFLHALAGAERARLKFIASGSAADEKGYWDAIDTAAKAQKSDGALFEAAYKKLGLTDTFFPNFGGLMSSNKVAAAAAATREAGTANAQAAAGRLACINGEISQCNKSDLLVPIPPAAAGTASVNPSLINSILGTYRDAGFSDAANSIVTLNESACLGAIPGPYVFQILQPNLALSTNQGSLRYLGDIFFSTSTISLKKLTKGTVTAPLVISNPLQFYRCPGKGLDLSRARTMLAIAAFAKAHPNVAPAQAKPLLQNSIAESDSVAYLRAALTDTTPGIQDELAPLALMLHDNSAGLEFVVGEVWRVTGHNLELEQKGYPIDGSLLFLFATHTPFASLLQFYNPSVLPAYAGIYAPGTLGDIRPVMLRYTGHPEARSGLVEFLRQYKNFEQQPAE